MNNILDSSYTVELRYLADDPDFDIFGFDYDFYEPMFMKNFERKFIDHYYFREIGAETVARWKHMLKSRLNMIMPYYKQLYETELACEGIQFMLNKDLKETFVRDVARDNEQSATQEGTNRNETESNSNGNTDFKESSLDNGNANLSYNMLTSINNTTNELNDNTSSNTTIQNTGNTKDRGTEKETTTLISQGNIGITSSAELLEKWRSVLINIDKMIIDECNDLFMGLY